MLKAIEAQNFPKIKTLVSGRKSQDLNTACLDIDECLKYYYKGEVITLIAFAVIIYERCDYEQLEILDFLCLEFEEDVNVAVLLGCFGGVTISLSSGMPTRR